MTTDSIPSRSYDIPGASPEALARSLRQAADWIEANKAEYVSGGLMFTNPSDGEVGISSNIVMRATA